MILCKDIYDEDTILMDAIIKNNSKLIRVRCTDILVWYYFLLFIIHDVLVWNDEVTIPN